MKDSNGKYILTESRTTKDRDQKEETLRNSVPLHTLSLEELDARLRKVERVVLDPRK